MKVLSAPRSRHPSDPSEKSIRDRGGNKKNWRLSMFISGVICISCLLSALSMYGASPIGEDQISGVPTVTLLPTGGSTGSKSQDEERGESAEDRRNTEEKENGNPKVGTGLAVEDVIRIANPYHKLKGTKLKTVMIYGHGRSGSTLAGTMFLSQGWIYHFEPLEKRAWPDNFQKQYKKDNGNCWLDGPPPKLVRCPVADIMSLIDEMHCRKTTHPHVALELELDGAGVDDTIKTVIAKPPPPSTKDEACTPQKTGLAVKTIRINGQLEHLFRLSNEMGDYGRVDLVIHLIRDPRSLLASRLSIGWGAPKTPSYQDTFDWGTETCGITMTDYTSNVGRPNYSLLRYEDLTMAALNRTADVYDMLGTPMPPLVKQRMMKNDVEGRQPACDTNAKDSRYSIRPQNPYAQLTKWKKKLSAEQIRAVQDSCKDLLEALYPDMDAMLATAETQLAKDCKAKRKTLQTGVAS